MCPLKMKQMSSGRSRDGSFNDWEVFHGSRVGHADIRELCRAPIMRKAQTKIVFLRPFFKHNRQNDIEWRELNSVAFVVNIFLHTRQLFAMYTRGGPELNYSIRFVIRTAATNIVKPREGIAEKRLLEA